jgi:hypothetical protein
MKKLVFISLLFIVGCNTPITSTTSKTAFNVSAKLPNWSAGKLASAKLYNSPIIFYGVTNVGLLAGAPQGTVLGDGQYSTTFPDGSTLEPTLQLAINQLNQTGCSVTVSPNDARVNLFLHYLFEGNTQIGWAMESNQPPTPPATSPASGSQSIAYFYADKAVNISGNCTSASVQITQVFNYNLSLQAGYNRVIYGYSRTNNSVTTSFSSGTLPTTLWYAIPGF